MVASGGRAIGLIAAGVVTIFILSVVLWLPQFQRPRLPGGHVHRSVFPRKVKPDVPSGLLAGRFRTELMTQIGREIAAAKARHAQVPQQRIVGFYNLDDTAIQSVRTYVQHLTHLMPQWLRLSSDGHTIDYRDFDQSINPRNAEIIQICRQNDVSIVPMLTNSDPTNNKSDFLPASIHALFLSPAKQVALAQELREWLLTNKFGGINVDFENLIESDRDKLPQFLTALRTTFSGTNLIVTADVEASTAAKVQAAIAEPCDFVILMAYDEHDEGGDAGPIASIPWTQTVVNKSLDGVPPEKLVLGMGAYSYDWRVGKPGANYDGYQEALTSAAGYLDTVPIKDRIKLDPDSLNSTYEYQDENGIDRVVWMQDGVSAYNQWRIGRSLGLTGFAIWAMGQEDPTIWSFLDRASRGDIDPSTTLSDVKFPFEVENIGKGELLTIQHDRQPGTRTIKVDPRTGLVNGATYQAFPSTYVIQHSGYRRGVVALTFDDGPDPQYTPEILDILQREHVPATFFVIGKNAEMAPELLQRMYRDGHEIGSHTFTHPDLGLVQPLRVTLELHATQRSIESIVGKSTVLFRPPYNADRDPGTPREVLPIRTASNLGYVTVGETTDPNDWASKIILPDGTTRDRTVDDIVTETIKGVKANDVPSLASREGGNCILLHDAGGDRSKTVTALPLIIETLRAEGYKFVAVSYLAGTNRAGVMPAPNPQDRYIILMDKIAFSVVYRGLQVLAYAFVTAIVLGLLRLTLIVPLALIFERRQRALTYSAGYAPAVSVIVAAFNEEKVITRTIASVLANGFAIMEVIVVDDGSSDRTSEITREAFGNDSRVKLIRQENMGKASALNVAMANTESELLVSVDADTQLRPDAIGKLIRHFHDPKIGAVAGNIQVGNAENVLTIWQSIEYTTSQNMDRRAYALLNGITVVPGALGAWRKSAIEAVGGHLDDTLAEDMDLTWRLREAGWTLTTESAAVAYTEAPNTMKGFFKQRFRWAYGTLQCLVKHRKSLGKYGFFGRVSLPGLWLFQVFFQAIAPLVDLQLLISLIGFFMAIGAAREGSVEISPLAQALGNLQGAGQLYVLFFAVELIASIIAYRLDGKRISSLWWLLLQRFVYRQIMYAVIIKSIQTAIRGVRQGWGKLDRNASVRLESQP